MKYNVPVIFCGIDANSAAEARQRLDDILEVAKIADHHTGSAEEKDKNYPIQHQDFYEQSKYLQAFSTNRVETLNKFVFIVFEEKRNDYCNVGQVGVVSTEDVGPYATNRIVSMTNARPYGVQVRYSLFNNLEAAVEHSKQVIEKKLQEST